MNGFGRYALGLVIALGCEELQARGSWVANAPETRVSMAGRETASDVLVPSSAEARNQAIHSIGWRYQHPPGSSLNVTLCHPAGCIPLPTMRGTTYALAGLAADVALEFRFSLAEGQRPVTVGELQVIVNHQ